MAAALVLFVVGKLVLAVVARWASRAVFFRRIKDKIVSQEDQGYRNFSAHHPGWLNIVYRSGSGCALDPNLPDGWGKGVGSRSLRQAPCHREIGSCIRLAWSKERIEGIEAERVWMSTVRQSTYGSSFREAVFIRVKIVTLFRAG